MLGEEPGYSGDVHDVCADVEGEGEGEGLHYFWGVDRGKRCEKVMLKW